MGLILNKCESVFKLTKRHGVNFLGGKIYRLVAPPLRHYCMAGVYRLFEIFSGMLLNLRVSMVEPIAPVVLLDLTKGRSEQRAHRLRQVSQFWQLDMYSQIGRGANDHQILVVMDTEPKPILNNKIHGFLINAC